MRATSSTGSGGKKTGPLSLEEVNDLCHWRTQLRDVALIGEYPDSGIGFGNLSARIGDSPRFLISGTQTGHCSHSTADQFSLVTRVDIPGNEVECEGPLRASSEAMTHAAIYAADMTIRAVVHVHDSRLWQHALEQLPTTDRKIPLRHTRHGKGICGAGCRTRVPGTRNCRDGGT